MSINIHHLGDQIEKYISKLKFKANIKISNEKQQLLDTGGGVKKGTQGFKDNPFFVINPDTLWTEKYSGRNSIFRKIYFKEKTPCLLLVNKELSIDKSFKGDFNLKNKIITKDEKKPIYFYRSADNFKRQFRFYK